MDPLNIFFIYLFGFCYIYRECNYDFSDLYSVPPFTNIVKYFLIDQNYVCIHFGNFFRYLTY